MYIEFDVPLSSQLYVTMYVLCMEAYIQGINIYAFLLSLRI